MMDNNQVSQCEALASGIREAVCIDTNRVYDSCADKDCLTDLRVYFTDKTQPAINEATSVKCRKVEIENAFIDVEEVPFNRGFYSVDITYFFCITLDVYSNPLNPPTCVTGLATFTKKCILYGSEGNVKVFSSEFKSDEDDKQNLPAGTNPRAKVQCVDPVCLEAKLCAAPSCHECCCVPKCVRNRFDGTFTAVPAEKTVYVTLGLFTIIQLERDVQMLIPAYDFCMPEKECCCDTDDPCEVFKKIKFPVEEFFPPRSTDADNSGCGCGCKR